MTPEQRKLVEDNMRLVHVVLRDRFGPLPGDYDDWVQIGMIGLCKAAMHFDPEKGKFSTLAVAAIQNEIRQRLRFDRQLRRGGGYRTLSLENPTANEDFTLEEIVPDPSQNVENAVIARGKLKRFLELADNRQTLLKAATGEIRQEDAAEMLGISQSFVSKLICKIRHIMQEEDESW